MRGLTIHALWHGKPCCGDQQLAGVPADWAENHKWVGVDTIIASMTMDPPQVPHGVNCKSCLRELADAMTVVLKVGAVERREPAVGTFAWAVAFKRPMRRAAWLHHKPTTGSDAEKYARLVEAYWVFLRVIPSGTSDSMWIRLSDGVVHRLQLEDYLAADWEVM